MSRYFLLAVAGLVATGCNSTRWAMDDPIYADKYHASLDRFDLPAKTKRAIDARHMAGRRGANIAGAFQSDPAAVGGEIGLFGYPTSWLSARTALSGVVDSLDDNSFGGVNLGLRVQAPSRIAPFVGLGTFNGISRGFELADSDNIDNDDDLLIDEPGEKAELFDGWRTSIYPEVGLHFWPTSRLRLNRQRRL